MAKNKKEVTSELEKKLCGMIKAVINEKFEENERGQKELFEKHEKIVANLMSDNLKIITNSINQIKKEVDEIKTSVEVTDNTLLKQEKAITNIQTKIKR